LNALLARRVLARKMTITLEHKSLINILKAAVMMGLFVGGYRMVVSLDNVGLALVPVVLGGVVYMVLVLKFDKKIYEELKGIMAKIDVV